MIRLTILLCLMAKLGFGQVDSLRTKLFKISPLHLFDLDNGLSFGFEKIYKERKSWQVEAGYGNSNANFWIALNENVNSSRDFKNFNNFRFRVEHRTYFRRNKNNAPLGTYYAFELMNKLVYRNSEILIGRNPIAGVPNYNELVNGKSQKLVFGFHPKIGKQFLLSPGQEGMENSWFFDVFAGIGFRVVSNSFIYENKQSDDQIPFAQQTSIGTIIGFNETAPIISGTFGMKFSYLF